jgi:hypothetical protein
MQVFNTITAAGLAHVFSEALHARLRHSHVSERVVALRMLMASSAPSERKHAKIIGSPLSSC